MLTLFCYAIIVLGAACAVVASTERILGRPIPRLRFSPRVRRQRMFILVPVCMTITFAWSMNSLLRLQVCSHCDKPFVWQSMPHIGGSALLSIGLAGVVGWIVFALLWTTFAVIGFWRRAR